MRLPRHCPATAHSQLGIEPSPHRYPSDFIWGIINPRTVLACDNATVEAAGKIVAGAKANSPFMISFAAPVGIGNWVKALLPMAARNRASAPSEGSRRFHPAGLAEVRNWLVQGQANPAQHLDKFYYFQSFRRIVNLYAKTKLTMPTRVLLTIRKLLGRYSAGNLRTR